MSLASRFDLDANLHTHPTVGVLSQNKAIDFPERLRNMIAMSRPATNAKASPSDVDVSFKPFIVFLIDCAMSSGNGILNTSGGWESFAQHITPPMPSIDASVKMITSGFFGTRSVAFVGSFATSLTITSVSSSVCRRSFFSFEIVNVCVLP